MVSDKEMDKYIERLYRETRSTLCAYALSALDDARLAEEAVQDTFRIACVKPESLLGSENPAGWLMNTLKRVILNIRRTQARLNRVIITTLSVDETAPAAPDGDAEFELNYSDMLSREDFELIKLVVIGRYTMLEASAELGISVEACKKRVQRIKAKLKKQLEDGS